MDHSINSEYFETTSLIHRFIVVCFLSSSIALCKEGGRSVSAHLLQTAFRSPRLWSILTFIYSRAMRRMRWFTNDGGLDWFIASIGLWSRVVAFPSFLGAACVCFPRATYSSSFAMLLALQKGASCRCQPDSIRRNDRSINEWRWDTHRILLQANLWEWRHVHEVNSFALDSKTIHSFRFLQIQSGTFCIFILMVINSWWISCGVQTSHPTHPMIVRYSAIRTFTPPRKWSSSLPIKAIFPFWNRLFLSSMTVLWRRERESLSFVWMACLKRS